MNNESVNLSQHNAPGQRTNEVISGINPVVIPVIEELIQIDINEVETGVVRLVKHVTEETQTVDIPTTKEEVIVDRVAIYQYVDTPPVIRYEGDTTIIPVLREVLVTEKKLLLVEEVHVTKRRTTEQDTQTFTLRKEEVTVERSTTDNERPA